MPDEQCHTTAPEDRVPWTQLAIYGMGGFIPIALLNSVGLLVGFLGNISLGLNAFWLGTILIIPKLWDAIADPLIGHYSDNTRTRWGRRRPYLLFGGVAVAVTFIAIWWVPRGDWVRDILASNFAYQVFHFAYILAILVLFYTAVSIFEIPHGALGMEMSPDYHERTRLFSAKSFLGNLFAMGTPWMFKLAEQESFGGTGGDPIDGMRYVSILVAALLIPMAVGWFFTLKEPAFSVVKEQRKSTFWHDMRKTVNNRNFLILVAIIFTLAMGFNFVQIFNYYITVFFLYGGDSKAAGDLLGWGGTAWAVTGLFAVFPLNWLSRRLGKNKTLLIAILLMCAAQVSKIFCYNPDLPYLVLIPTVLLSAGMLMFFTLASSMVGDVTDEDELKSGTRSEGSFYSVFWWFISTGTAFAGVVMGALIVFTAFDQTQNVAVESMQGNLERIRAHAKNSRLAAQPGGPSGLNARWNDLVESSHELRRHLADQMEKQPDQFTHFDRLVERIDSVRSDIEALRARTGNRGMTFDEIARATDSLLQQMPLLKQQSPKTLLRLRVLEITVPLALSIISIVLTLRYPLTEARCYEIKAALERRRGELGS